MVKEKTKKATHLNGLDTWRCPYCNKLFNANKTDYGLVQECPNCHKSVKLDDPFDRMIEKAEAE